MNKVTLIAVLLVLAGVGVFFLTQLRSSDSGKEMVGQEGGSQSNVPSEAGIKKAQVATESTNGVAGTKYLPFSSEVLSSSVSRRRVLFFFANWCPTCRPADQNFSENVSRIPSDVVLIRVNYNDTDTDQSEKELATKYGVTYQHTFIQIDSGGNVVTKWNGGQI
jgi:thioredoxin 1